MIGDSRREKEGWWKEETKSKGMKSGLHCDWRNGGSGERETKRKCGGVGKGGAHFPGLGEPPFAPGGTPQLNVTLQPPQTQPVASRNYDYCIDTWMCTCFNETHNDYTNDPRRESLVLFKVDS